MLCQVSLYSYFRSCDDCASAYNKKQCLISQDFLFLYAGIKNRGSVLGWGMVMCLPLGQPSDMQYCDGLNRNRYYDLAEATSSISLRSDANPDLVATIHSINFTLSDMRSESVLTNELGSLQSNKCYSFSV